MTQDEPVGIADLAPLARRREQRAWYWYDWANSAYVTTVATVLFAPYLTSVAETAACGAPGTVDAPCKVDLRLLGLLEVSPGSLVFYVVTLATVISALVLPVVGAAADRSARKTQIMATFAWAGSACAAGMFLVTGDSWELGALLLFGANICLGSSLVVYDAILCEIATPAERDAVSSKGWAMGYLGGGLLLLINLALVSAPGVIGVSTEWAVRISLFSAGLWWAGFTLIPYLGLRDRPAAAAPSGGVPGAAPSGSGLGSSFSQLAATLRHLRGYPEALLFLVAYLFYNDGIQTVIVAASTFGQEELGLEDQQLILTVLVVQFVGAVGAILFGRMAARVGAHRTILLTLVLWCAVVAAGLMLPRERFGLFLALGFGIGLVLGGSQALSRSLFSSLIPRGREAEYFSLYQAAERGTSWLGTLVFGLVHQLTGSYRIGIGTLVVFFVVGGLLLRTVDIERGRRRATEPVPAGPAA
jgi:UMF1 family MFS transporter